MPSIARHGRLAAHTGRFVLSIVGAVLAVLLVSTASVAAIATWRLSAQLQDKAVDISSPTEAPLPKIGAIPGGFNILIVGSDTRDGQQGIGGTVEDASGDLNDVNILLHVSQDQTNAVAVSIPRDMVVDIPDCTGSDGYVKDWSTEPVNTALSYGGLACAVSTVENLTGLDIQFAGKITFTGVIALSDAIGGVDVCTDGPVIDPNTGINLTGAGTWNLQGENALAFLRTRMGVGDGSDLTRISSQQVFLSALVRKLKSEETLGDVGKLVKLANTAAANLQLSTSLASVDTMVSIALALKNIPMDRVTFVQYPGATGGSGVYEGKVQPLTDAATELFDYIRTDQPFRLAAAGDGEGSAIDPNAPATDPSAPATDDSGLPVLSSVTTGQRASDYTCSVSNFY